MSNYNDKQHKFTNQMLDTIIKLVEREEAKICKARELLDSSINHKEHFALHKLHSHYNVISMYAKRIKEQQLFISDCLIIDD